MATKQSSDLAIPKEVTKALNTVAKGAGVAVKEIWTIFVRQHLVRGITEAFTGVVLCVASALLYSTIKLWVLVPLVIALSFFYSAITLIGNPKYYALEDISARIKEIKDGDRPVVSQSRSRYY